MMIRSRTSAKKPVADIILAHYGAFVKLSLGERVVRVENGVVGELVELGAVGVYRMMMFDMYGM